MDRSRRVLAGQGRDFGEALWGGRANFLCAGVDLERLHGSSPPESVE
jgi:hypothetical protein